MSTNVRILSAGVVTCVIVAVGFGSSLLAQSRVKQPLGYQPPAIAQPLTPVRVILPASAEPAHPPQQPAVQQAEVRTPQVPVAKVESGAAVKRVADGRRGQPRRHVERKTRMIAAREPLERRTVPGIMAYSGDEPRVAAFPMN